MPTLRFQSLTKPARGGALRSLVTEACLLLSFRLGRLVLLCVALTLAAPQLTRAVSLESPPKKIVVMGDSLGEGLFAGLRIRLKDSAVDLEKWTRVNTGIVRSDRYDWMDAADQIAKEGNVDMVIAMFGANDLQSIREGGHAYHYPSDGWKERYVGRVDHIMATLKAAGITVEWIGLPITRPNRYQKDYAFLNDIFKERAEANGIDFFDTWSATADANGEYEAFGTDINNNKLQIRDSDGVHFTGPGYVVLADKVVQAIGL